MLYAVANMRRLIRRIRPTNRTAADPEDSPYL